jgi:hypothetical protein
LLIHDHDQVIQHSHSELSPWLLLLSGSSRSSRSLQESNWLTITVQYYFCVHKSGIRQSDRERPTVEQTTVRTPQSRQFTVNKRDQTYERVISSDHKHLPSAMGIRSHSFTHIYWEKAIYNQRNQTRWDRCCNVATTVR